MKRILCAAFAVCTAFFACSCEGAPQKTELSFFAMDTVMTLTVWGEQAADAAEKARERIMELDGLWSVTDESSEIYRINSAAGKPEEVSEVTARLLAFALETAEKTDGAFDPTIYPAVRAWGFTGEENRVPGEAEIKELMRSVGYEKAELLGTRVSLSDGAMLDMGAAAKGFAADEAARILREYGVSSALMDLGGNIQAEGASPNGEAWRIGIRDPLGEGLTGILEITDAAVVTSGAYERCFTDDDGQTYGHIIDPATGYPVKNGIAQTTVVAAEGKLADAMSTALYVMGMEKAEDYWRRVGGFDMIIVTDAGEIYVTESIADSFSAEKEVKVIKRDE